MAVTNVTYAGAAGTAITLTLTSLANGSWRQSTVVVNTSDLYIDALVGGSVQVGTSPTAGSTIDIYAYGQYDASGEYTGGASGSDSAYTAGEDVGTLRFLTSIVVGPSGTSDVDYEWGPVSVAQAFGGVLPQRWGLVVENNTGATLNATGTNNETAYTGIDYTTA